MTGMSSEWFNMVLSLLKRQHHIKVFWSDRYIASGLDEFEIDLENGMTLEWGMMLTWQEWPLNVILSFERHSINLSSWWQYTVIRVSFHSFHGHSSTGMTRNDITLEWQEWCWNDGFGHSQHIPLIPDCWEKWGHSWFHPCHSGLIPSFGVIRKCSTNVNFPRMTSEWRKILSWSGPVSLSIDDKDIPRPR